MGNTSLTTAGSPSAIPAVENAGTRNTSMDEPVYTVIKRNGVEVAPLPASLDLPAYPNSEEGSESVLIRGVDWQKNGTDLIDKEPSVIDLITNLPVVESPSNTLEITDMVIKKSGTAIKTGPKNLNFTGEILVTDEGDEVTVNLAGKGFFGDGSDGDYTLDGTQAAVSELFTKASAESDKVITAILPLKVVETVNSISANYYKTRHINPVSAVASTKKIVIDIAMNSGFAGGDVEQTATIDCTYLDSDGVETRDTFRVLISKVNSSSQIEAEAVSPSGTLLTPISPYRTETVYSLSVGSKSSTAEGTLERPSLGYIELDEELFTADYETRLLQCSVDAIDYSFLIQDYISSTIVTVMMLSPRETISTLAIDEFTIRYSNITKNFIEDLAGKADVMQSYAEYVLGQLGQNVNLSAVVVFSADHSLTSNEMIRISGVTGIDDINGVWRIISLGSNIVILVGYEFEDDSLVGSSGTARKLVTYTLARDAFFGSLTITDAARLCTNNYRLFVKDELTINGSIGNNGDEAGTTGYFPSMGTGANGGAGGITAFPTPAAGKAGSTGSSQTNPIFNSSEESGYSIGGNGGQGDGSVIDGGSGGAFGASGSSTKITEPFVTRFNLITGNCFTFAGTTFRLKTHASAGGGGGGGVGGYYSISYNGGRGGAGGRGGNNAGYLLICAGSIIGTGIISSVGESGENGYNGSVGQVVAGADQTYSGGGGGGAGGGGGSAGVIVLMTRYISTTISKTVIGGVGGWGGMVLRSNPVGSTVKVAPSGTAGYIGRTGIVYEFIIT